MGPSNQAQALMFIYYRRDPHNKKPLNEKCRSRCIYHLPYIISLFQKFAKKYKNSPIVKKAQARWGKVR